MKDLKIFKIKYKNKEVSYKIGSMPEFTPDVAYMQFRTIPKFIVKHIIAKNLSKKCYAIIWKSGYPNWKLNCCKINLRAIKHNITELYKRLTTKNYVVPEYKWMSNNTGELLKDSKEVSKDIWWHIKHGCFPPIYVYNPRKF